MPQFGMDSERELSAEAVVRAAEEKSLGALVDTLPLQKRGLFRFKDTGHLVHRFEQGFVDDPRTGAALLAAMRYDQISWVRQSYLKHYINHYYNRTSFRLTIGSLAGEVVRWEGSFWDDDHAGRRQQGRSEASHVRPGPCREGLAGPAACPSQGPCRRQAPNLRPRRHQPARGAGARRRGALVAGRTARVRPRRGDRQAHRAARAASGEYAPRLNPELAAVPHPLREPAPGPVNLTGAASLTPLPAVRIVATRAAACRWGWA